MKTLIKITSFLMMLLTSFSIQAQYNAGTGSGTSGGNRTFVGVNAGRVNTGANNTFVGRNVGYDNTTGYSNTFMGATAGRFNTTGIENSFFGRGSGYRNTTGKSNVFLGIYAGYDNTTASYNTFVGERAGRFNTTAQYGTFVGRRAGYSNTTGQYNVFIGSAAGYDNTTGANNTFVGTSTGRFNTTGGSNLFAGIYAGYDNTSASYNTFLGERAGRFNTTAQYGTFVGRRSGYSNTTGQYNAFVGANTGYANTTGGSNTFIGQAAGRFNTTGDRNTFIGYQSGYDVVTGEDNTMLGYRAGYNATGTRNVFIGYAAGYNEAGSNKLYIDNSSTANPLIEGDFSDDILTFNGQVGVNGDVPVIPNDQIELYVNGRFSQRQAGTFGGFAGSDRWASLGDSPVSNIYGLLTQGYGSTLITGSKSGGHNIIGFSGASLDFDVIGAGGPTQTVFSIASSGNAGLGIAPDPIYKLCVGGSAFATTSWVSSDKRYKENIKPIASALDKINALDGVSYGFQKKTINGIDFSQLKRGSHLGFIAQDLEEVFPELVQKDSEGYYAVNYDGLIPVLVEAIKEQQDVIDEKETLIDEQQEQMIQQQEQIIDLQSRMERLEALLANGEDIQGNILPSNQDINIAGVMLRQNAPNPFSDRTTIQYELPDNLGIASLMVYDLNSRQIATYSIAGKGSIEFDASGLPNGTYGYAIMVNGKSIASQKMIIQR